MENWSEFQNFEENRFNMEERGEIIMYQPDSEVKLEVRLEDETVWLNRQQMSVLFGRDVKTIGKHVQNALKEELSGISVVANFATTAADGKIYKVQYYNLDVILSVGYRVKSYRGVEFRRWASKILKEYLLKGYRAEDIVRSRENCFWSKPDLSTTALWASGQDDIARDDRVGNICG